MAPPAKSPLGWIASAFSWLIRLFIAKRVVETAFDIRLFAIKSYGLVIHEFGKTRRCSTCFDTRGRREALTLSRRPTRRPLFFCALLPQTHGSTSVPRSTLPTTA